MAQGKVRLRHTDRRLVVTQIGVELDLGLSFRAVIYTVRPINLAGQGFDLLFDGLLGIVEELKVRGFFGRLDNSLG